MNFQLLHHDLLKGYLSPWISFEPLSKVICAYLCGALSGFSVLFHWSMYLSFHQYYSLDYSGYVINHGIGQTNSFHFILLFFKILKLDPLLFHIKLKIILSTSIKIFLSFWEEIAVKTYISPSGEYRSSTLWTWHVFPFI